ncbi:MAG TPA: TonB-dependent receptor [Terriglobia bacterium]|nr:TonB-dependent receptor [Terriglobia bacterium]
MSRVGRRVLTALAGTLLFLACVPLPVHAQELRATINGTITDPSGAPVPGAKIQITDVQRNSTYSTVSNDVGRYTSIPLLASTYSISVEAKGFKKYVRSGIILSLSQTAAVNVHLEVGAVTQTVNVSSRAPLLDTETANRGAIIPTNFLENLPNPGRDLFNLVFIMPGATQPCTCRGQGVTITGVGHSAFNINGSAGGPSGRAGNNGILLNGVSDRQGGSNATLQPALYAIDEVQVKTSSYDAQYGRTGGGFVAITTKAGTNSLHGIVFDSVNNSALGAASWETNANGDKKQSSILSNYGFEVGGPVYIPKVYNGRDKLFFMVSWDRTPFKGTDSNTGTVPTMAMRNGDFSGLLNSAGNPVTIYDPLTTVPDGNGGFTRTPFEGNIIPTDRIDAVGQNIANLYPHPSNDGTNPAHSNNLSQLAPNSDTINQWIERVDYRLNEKNRVYAQFGRTTESIFSSDIYTNYFLDTGSSLPGQNNSMQGMFDWTSTINPTTIWDLRAGFTRLEQTRDNTLQNGYDPTKLGFPSSWVTQLPHIQLPHFGMGSYSPIGSDGSIGRGTLDQDLDIQMSLAKSVGKHLVRIGAQFLQYNAAVLNPGYAGGTFSFAKQWTQQNPLNSDAVSGNEIADLLLGLASNGDSSGASSYVDNNPNPYYTSHDWAVYFQDDWKVSHRLTLNLGLRWDYQTPVTERFNRMTRGFAFGQTSPLASLVANAPGASNCPACANLTGGLLFVGNAGIGQYGWNPDRKDFEPRIGFAYQLDNKTVLRGGFGLYHLLMVNDAGLGGFNYGFAVQTPLTASLDGGITPNVTLSNPYPDGLLAAPGSSQGLSTLLGTSVQETSVHFPAPKSYQWSIGFQRQLPAGLVVDAAYVGNKTTGYPLNANLNFIPAPALGQSDTYYKTLVTNPFAGLLPSNPALNGETIQQQDLLVAYPQFSQVTQQNSPMGSARYDAMQLSIKRRFSNGTFVMVNYTISKNLQRMQLLNPQDYNILNPTLSSLEQTLMPFDIPQNLQLLGTYHLPFGRQERFGKGMPVAADYIVGGWKLGWTISFQSGYPVAFPNAAPISPGSAVLPASQRTYDRWFNTSKFPTTGQAPFTLRNFPSEFPDVRYMGFNNWDFSLVKDVPLYERAKLRVRGDFINAFNHPYFTQMQSLSVSNNQFGALRRSQNNDPRSIVIEADVIF